MAAPKIDPFDVPIEPIRPPHVEIDPSLRTITRGVPHRDALDASIPDVRAATEERFKNFDKNAVTHVVIQITITRQTQIFKSVGYQYDWNVPSPFWDFLGRMVAKAIFDDKIELKELNFVAIRRREFIAYTTSVWKAAAETQKAAGKTSMDGMPPPNVVEVNFKKPQPGEPIKMTWTPARPLFTAKIRQWNEIRGDPLDHQTPKELR